MRRIEPIRLSDKANTDAAPAKYGVAFYAVAILLLAALFWAYAHHFDNPFEFDDDHTITRNSALDTLDIGKFLGDARTYSTLPANQAWRPGVTILNSIDTVLSKDRVPDPKVFHIHIFAWYILLGVLLYFMFLHLLRKAFPAFKHAAMAALLGSGFFMLHTANAETINYIISRSDSQSTVFVVTGMLMFMYSEHCRQYFLYIIPMVIGFLVKETTIMLAPLLFVYCWLFMPRLLDHVLGITFAFIAGIAMYLISRFMTPDTWVSGGQNPLLYLCTQAFVIVHYFFTFILPVNLSADTDWTYVTSPFDTRVMAGAVFILLLLLLAFRWARKPETRIGAFGIFWFFIALAPTSSIFPFAEVMNDHRIFFPFIGLVMVAMNLGVLYFHRFEQGNYFMRKAVPFVVIAGLLTAHTLGTRARCEVWGSGESLWKDVTEKSPGNPRGWMNYGLAIMSRNTAGATDSAITYFNKTIELSPGYVYARVNMAVAQDRKGNLAEAENQYRMAMLCDSLNPEALYFYGEWLVRHDRIQEGLRYLRRGHEVSPGHAGINAMLAAWDGKNYVSGLQAALETADKNPTPENLVALSLEWYQAGEYLQCALTAEKAAALKPDYHLAWNNVCAGYNKIGEWDKAIAAGEKAVALTPNDELAKNNLAVAQGEKQRFNQLTTDATSAPTYDKWILLSLEWYKVSNFAKSLEAANEAVKMNASDATGWNNVCAAATKLGDYDLAIEAGEKAVKIRPDWELANNNLKEAKRLKSTK